LLDLFQLKAASAAPVAQASADLLSTRPSDTLIVVEGGRCIGVRMGLTSQAANAGPSMAPPTMTPTMPRPSMVRAPPVRPSSSPTRAPPRSSASPSQAPPLSPTQPAAGFSAWPRLSAPVRGEAPQALTVGVGPAALPRPPVPG